MGAKKKAHIDTVTASAGKGKKAKEKIDAATREADDWQYKLTVKQQAELELLLEHLGGGAAKAGGYDAKEPPVPQESKPADAAEEVVTEEERARRKKEKAQKKKQGKADKL